MLVFVLFYKKSIRSSSQKSSVLCFLLLFCPGHGPPSALPANCPGFLHPSGTAGGGLWHGDSHPGATIQMALRPRCALLWGATPDIVGRRYHLFAGGTHPNRRGYLLPGA